MSDTETTEGRRPPAHFTGRLPWNDWTMGETERLIRLVILETPTPAMIEELRRFKWSQINAKIDALVEQGFLVRRGGAIT